MACARTLPFLLLLVAIVCGCAKTPGAAPPSTGPFQVPLPGSCELRILTPTLLELFLVTEKEPDPARLEVWDFVDAAGKPRLPLPGYFEVSTGTETIPVTEVGFKRRTLYAPIKQRDLRVGNWLYLRLQNPVPENADMVVTSPDRKVIPETTRFAEKADPNRWSPVIHLNQTGYMPAWRKIAMVGYYLGSLGELDLQNDDQKLEFRLVENQAGKEVFRGTMKPRPDQGFSRESYQRVLQADFTEFRQPGEYRLVVDGLGSSFPFRIDEGTAAAFARTYALGLYHQRCGAENVLPYTRFSHRPCHTAPAEVPTMADRFASANEELKKETANSKEEPRHSAPALTNVTASLYPFINRGPVDVRGGHHDAGDYSKYTINSAGFIHHLVFAADVFPGVKDLDNLGLPESGDGRSDVLQEAKWEADFLAKMQDADGGFYFLVYPRDRAYESDVLPDRGDPQVVFPKTTSVTAAATAALAQCAGSPAFKAQFPDAAADYLGKARKGWKFLEQALARFGKDGSYQKITHYGDEFLHDDEIAWAACELYLATGELQYHPEVLTRLTPSSPNTRKWGWLRLFDAWGCAIRSYAFAERSGRLPRSKVNLSLLEQCQQEIEAAGREQLKRSDESAYGTSFPDETKRARSAGWYFFADAAFDLAVAMQLEYPPKNSPVPSMMDALLANLDYEQGCNPINVCYLTGLGKKRQTEIVHQFAVNDDRLLPPSGIPLGNIQAGISWIGVYGKEPAQLSFPSDSAETGGYPFYDRWSDAFNLSQEFVILHQARGLGVLAWLMARTPAKKQEWKSPPGKVVVQEGRSGESPTLRISLVTPELDLESAEVIWEGKGLQPARGNPWVLSGGAQADWIEAEAQLPDGKRVFARTNLVSGARR